MTVFYGARDNLDLLEVTGAVTDPRRPALPLMHVTRLRWAERVLEFAAGVALVWLAWAAV